MAKYFIPAKAAITPGHITINAYFCDSYQKEVCVHILQAVSFPLLRQDDVF